MKKENGYFTVEAALIISMIIGVLMLIIYMVFFQYNRCLLEQDMGALALKGCTIQENNKELLWKRLKQYEDEIYWEKYMLWEQGNVEIGLVGAEVRISSSGVVRFPFSNLLEEQIESLWSVETGYKNQRMEPVNFIRMYRRLAGGE